MKSASLKNNIPLMYILTALDFSWFWVAIWVLFYLRFTDYAGIGLLEAIMVITMVLGEIPTGAIADLFGKTKTMRMAYLISGMGFFFVGIGTNFTQVAAGVIVATLGGTFGSGTTEAFIYDSLLSVKNEHSYEKVLGNISTIKMITFALCSLLGGVMYSFNPGLPFIALGLTKGIAVLLSFFLVEPPIDTDTFSLKNYLRQTKAGFSQLYKSRTIQFQTTLLLLLSMIVIMNTQVLIDVHLVGKRRSWA